VQQQRETKYRDKGSLILGWDAWSPKEVLRRSHHQFQKHIQNNHSCMAVGSGLSAPAAIVAVRQLQTCVPTTPTLAHRASIAGAITSPVDPGRKLPTSPAARDHSMNVSNGTEQRGVQYTT